MHLRESNVLTTPVLFLIFNRPDLARRVFEKIRQQKPTQLFIAADGPRDGNKNDGMLCKKAREVVGMIDWPCQVKTLFRSKNLGCGQAVSEAISWFFSYVEEGVILEDDCVPDDTFFSFCSELLSYYKDEERVMHIGGSNFQLKHWRGKNSYYFSRYVHVWGWATWRRAWQNYDFNCKNYVPEFDYGFGKLLKKELELTLKHEIDTWDHQWHFCVRNNRGLSITPNKCLIRNIGFDENPTNTLFSPQWLKKMNYGYIEHLIHPTEIQICEEADHFTAQHIFKYPYVKEIIFDVFPFRKPLKKLWRIVLNQFRLFASQTFF